MYREIRSCARSTILERAQATTIILQLLKIGVRVQTSVRRIIFHLPRGYPDRTAWMQISSAFIRPG